LVLDQHMSVLEGSLGMLPRRIVVDDEHWAIARQLLEDAGLAHELRPGSGGPKPETTDDAILGGRLRITQKKRGHRVGHDAILLAAATGARPGDRVIEFGAGVGAAGLALARRCPEVDVTLVEIDAELSAIASDNVLRNGLTQRVRSVTLDVTAAADEFAAHGIGPGSADRVLMNPPFNNPIRQNVSPDPGRRAAHVARDGVLNDWVAAAVWVLHSAGTMTLIWRADGLQDVLAALHGRFGDVAVLPVHGRAGTPAIRVVVRARKGSHAPFALLPGLALNDETGKPTAAAEAVLRGAEALPLVSD
jgi:tRNA1(Val) A37 N6-methylase TrmN6